MLSRCRFAGLSLARSAGARTASTMPAFPNAAVAKSMTRHMSEVSGENLFILAGAGNQDAIRERVRREIMAKDGVEYEETTVRLQEMSAVACANHHFYMFPFQVGIVSAGVSGVLSLPLVFSYRCASWFNDIFVTADPPELGDYDTLLEVGAWSWNWMEPPLGTISFFLLCMQYVRDKRVETGRQGAMVEYLKAKQGKLLAQTYAAEYDEGVLYAYGASIAMISDAEIIAHEHERIMQRMAALKST